MTLQEIQDLIKILSKSNIAELRLEREDVKLTLRTKDYTDGRTMQAPVIQQVPMAAPSPTAAHVHNAPAASAPTKAEKAEAAEKETNADYITIKSPMIGTFYRSAGPDKDVFVKVGDSIKPGQVLCIVEAMKLFNEIESEVSGKIVKILVENASPIEYEQPLFLIDPKG